MQQQLFLSLANTIQENPGYDLNAAVTRLLKLPDDESFRRPLTEPEAARAMSERIYPSAGIDVRDNGHSFTVTLHPRGWKAPVRRTYVSEAGAICLCVLCARFLEVDDVRYMKEATSH